MLIWFHGTNAKNARCILKDGLRSGSYLAKHLEDALAFGGPHVFEFALDVEKIKGPADWQLHTRENIPTTSIVGYTVFHKNICFDDPDLRREIFEANEDGSVSGFVGKVEEHRWREPVDFCDKYGDKPQPP